MAGNRLFSQTVFDRGVKVTQLSERAAQLDRIAAFETIVTEYLSKRTRRDGTKAERMASARQYAEKQLGYSV